MVRHKIYALSTRIRGKLAAVVYRKQIQGKGRLILDRNTHLILAKNSRINIQGSLRLNDKCIVQNGRSTLLRIDPDGELNVRGNASIFYGGDVTVFRGGKLEIGNSYINSDAKIRCHKHISIGDDCAISHNLTVMDSDVHNLNGDNHTAEVRIGNHGWIGTHVTILSGVTIGDGAVIAAGTIVNRDVPPRTMVAGVPGTVIKSDVEWSK